MRYPKEILTLRSNGDPLFSVVPLLVLPLEVKLTPKLGLAPWTPLSLDIFVANFSTESPQFGAFRRRARAGGKL